MGIKSTGMGTKRSEQDPTLVDVTYQCWKSSQQLGWKLPVSDVVVVDLSESSDYLTHHQLLEELKVLKSLTYRSVA